MNKAEMIKEVAKRLDGCTKADVQAVIETYVDVVKETLENDVTDTVILPGLGKFVVKQIPEKAGVSPFDGKPWKKPAHNELKFTVVSSAKEV